MNIAFCYITPFHPQKGGIGRVTDVLTRELQKRGHNIYYLIFESGMTIKHEFDYPAPLTYLPSKERLSEENIKFYHQFLKQNHIDIVVDQGGNFDEHPLWLNVGDSHAKKISVIHTYDTVTYRNLWNLNVIPLRDSTLIAHAKRLARIILYPRTRRRIFNYMTRSYASMFRLTDKIVGLSANYLPELEEICPSISQKYTSIGNPAPYTPSQFQSTKRNKTKSILFVGLFSTAKGEDKAALIWRKICKKYPDWTFNMIGYGNEIRTKRLKKIVAGIPNFNLLGYQNPLPYQQEASIACMTSPHEGWPLVLMEAMQCGAVPIAYNSFASASDIIESGVSGELVTPFNENEYIAKLSRLIEDDEYRERLSKNACTFAKRINVEAIADKWEMLFNELIDK